LDQHMLTVLDHWSLIMFKKLGFLIIIIMCMRLWCVHKKDETLIFSHENHVACKTKIEASVLDNVDKASLSLVVW